MPVTASPVQPADFACVSAFGAVGRLIEVGEWANGDGFAPYEHVLGYAGYYSDTPDPQPNPRTVPIVGRGAGHYVIEAQPGGARLRRLDFAPEDYPGALWSTGLIPLTDYQRLMIHEAAWSLLGTPYSALDYFALAAHRLRLHPLDNLLKGRVGSSQHLICSQLWDLAYQRGGVQLFDDGRWPGYVTPLDMALLLERKRDYGG